MLENYLIETISIQARKGRFNDYNQDILFLDNLKVVNWQENRTKSNRMKV